MKIGIDARLIDETGVGRYIRNLLSQLAIASGHNQYIIFLRSSAYDTFILPNDTWQKRRADVPWHSLEEQLIMPILFLRERLDIVHIPYFNVPILYLGKFIPTLHDLTILHMHTGRATTLPLLAYKVRRLGYRFLLWAGVHRAAHIITVSHVTKKEIIDHFGISAEKITVTYEGVDDIFKLSVKSKKSIVEQAKYMLYVGNAYPHKNVELVLRAIAQDSTLPHLVLVGRHDFFYKRLLTLAASLGVESRLTFWGQATDEQLQQLYAHAQVLVFPSFMEGFGLPALEAFASGCPVVASDIPVFHEILKDAAIYFDPRDEKSLSKAIHHAEGKKHSLSYREKIISRSLQFTWDTMAAKTRAVYRRSV